MVNPQGLFRALGHEPKVKSKRRKHDFYPTPAPVTHALLRAEKRDLERFDTVCDPACGDGAILSLAEAHGYRVQGSDLVRRWPDDRPYRVADIYHLPAFTDPVPAVVINPPFSEIRAQNGEVPLVQRLFDLGADYVAMLAGATWNYPRDRQGWLARNPVARIYALSWRIDWDGRGNPSQSHAWYVWDRQHQGQTEHHVLLRPKDYGW